MRECLSLRGVTAGYTDSQKRGSGRLEGPEKNQLRDVDVTLAAAELVCLLGPNGAGKTTLLRVASGLLAPSAGEVHLLGHELRSLSRAEIARSLAVVEQQQELAMGFTVREVVSM